MAEKQMYMCSNCDTEYDAAENAVMCCQCENCGILEAQLGDLKEAWQLLRKRTMPSAELNRKYDQAFKRVLG